MYNLMVVRGAAYYGEPMKMLYDYEDTYTPHLYRGKEDERNCIFFSLEVVIEWAANFKYSFARLRRKL